MKVVVMRSILINGRNRRKYASSDSCLSCISDHNCSAGETCCNNECVLHHCGAIGLGLENLITLILVQCFVGAVICVIFSSCWYKKWKEARVRNTRARTETTTQRSSPRLGRSSLSTTDHNDHCYTNDPQSLPPYDQGSPSYMLIVPYEQIPPMETSLSLPPPPGASTQTELVTAQNNSPHLGQSPPLYDQSSPNYSPPPYEQIAHIEVSRPPPPSPGVSAQTETASQSPPPYEPNTPTEPNEPPPPYSEEQEGIPGGVSTSQNTYPQGAEPTNYALIVWV